MTYILLTCFSADFNSNNSRMRLFNLTQFSDGNSKCK